MRQELASELGIVVSLRTGERSVSHLQREFTAEALATVQVETPPGRQLQINFGQRRIAVVGEDPGRVSLCGDPRSLAGYEQVTGSGR